MSELETSMDIIIQPQDQQQQQMSAQEIIQQKMYKDNLFANLQQTGLIDSLKSKLRSDVMQQLKLKGNINIISKDNKENNASISNQSANKLAPTSQPNYFRRRLLTTLVVNFLKTNDCQYSLSVLLPELKLVDNSLLSQQEVIDYISKNAVASKDNPVYKQHLQQIKQNQQAMSLLELLLDCALDHHSKETSSRSVQTDQYVIDQNQNLNGQNIHLNDNYNLQEKLRIIDEQFMKKTDYFNISQPQNTDEAMLSYKRIAEQRYHAMLQEEVERIRRNEVPSARMEEAHLQQNKFMEYKKIQDEEYNKRLLKLKVREDEALQLMTRKLEELQKAEHESRARMERQMDEIKLKEVQFHRHKCIDHEDVVKETRKAKELEKELQYKLKEYENARKTMQTHIELDVQMRTQQIEREHNRYNVLDVKKQLEDEREFIRTQKESLFNMDKQRQYLSNEVDNLRKDNGELERGMALQKSEIIQLREAIQSIRQNLESANMMKESQAHKINEFENVKDSLQRGLQQAEIKIKQQHQAQLELLQQYQQEMSKWQAKIVQADTVHSRSMCEMEERHLQEKQNLQDRVRSLESLVSVLRQRERSGDTLALTKSTIKQQQLQLQQTSIDQTNQLIIPQMEAFLDEGNERHIRNVLRIKQEMDDLVKEFGQYASFSQSQTLFDSKGNGNNVLIDNYTNNINTNNTNSTISHEDSKTYVNAIQQRTQSNQQQQQQPPPPKLQFTSPLETINEYHSGTMPKEEEDRQIQLEILNNQAQSQLAKQQNQHISRGNLIQLKKPPVLQQPVEQTQLNASDMPLQQTFTFQKKADQAQIYQIQGPVASKELVQTDLETSTQQAQQTLKTQQKQQEAQQAPAQEKQGKLSRRFQQAFEYGNKQQQISQVAVQVVTTNMDVEEVISESEGISPSLLSPTSKLSKHNRLPSITSSSLSKSNKQTTTLQQQQQQNVNLQDGIESDLSLSKQERSFKTSGGAGGQQMESSLSSSSQLNKHMQQMQVQTSSLMTKGKHIQINSPTKKPATSSTSQVLQATQTAQVKIPLTLISPSQISPDRSAAYSQKQKSKELDLPLFPEVIEPLAKIQSKGTRFDPLGLGSKSKEQHQQTVVENQQGQQQIIQKSVDNNKKKQSQQIQQEQDLNYNVPEEIEEDLEYEDAAFEEIAESDLFK